MCFPYALPVGDNLTTHNSFGVAFVLFKYVCNAPIEVSLSASPAEALKSGLLFPFWKPPCKI
jgi:hypothetical protein